MDELAMLNFSATLSRVVKAYQDGWMGLMAVGLVVQVVAFVYELILGASGVGITTQVLLAILPTFLTIAMDAALILAADDVLDGRRRPALDYYRALLPRYLPFLGAAVVTGVVAAVASVFLIVPGVWLGTAFSLALPALLLERLGVFESLGRSWRLVEGGFWRVFGVLILIAILVGFASFLLLLPVAAPSAVTGAPVGPFPLAWRTLVQVLLYPLVPIAQTVLFRQRRALKDPPPRASHLPPDAAPA